MQSRILLAAALLIPIQLTAQEETPWELGLRAGLSVLVSDDTDVVSFSIPGAAPSPLASFLGGSSSVHLAFFPTSSLMLEPQISFSVFNVSNGESETITSFGASGQVAYLFNTIPANTPYVGFSGAFYNLSGGDESESDFAFGGNVGYRVVVSDGAVLRVEGAYRRWLDFEINEINAALILAILFH